MRWPRLFRVQGQSMQPWAAEGDYLFTWPSTASRLRPGHVVVAEHDRLGTIVKRVAARRGATLMLAGDHEDSASSAAIGPLPVRCVVGRVLVRIPVHQPTRRSS